jgi:putative addiction module killer protein
LFNIWYTLNMKTPMTLEYYETPSGKSPVRDWLNSLDSKDFSVVINRIQRLEQGNFQSCKPVGKNLFEIVINHGPGYRVYYTLRGQKIILVLLGGDKSSQDKNIKKALTLI